MLPAETLDDLKKIILQQQVHYSDFVQKVIRLLTLEGKNREAEIVRGVAASYGLIKDNIKSNEHGHLDIDEMYHLIIQLLKARDLTGTELRIHIGHNRIYAPTYYKALKDLISEKKISRFGIGSGTTYSLNESNDEKAS